MKACCINEEAGLGIVARLGGFDTLITYLGGIGKIMKGSGIEELFNEVYPENTVQHIISGKDVSRALQAHPGKRFQKFPDVNLKEDIVIPFTREKFLSNSNNKVQLIKMLSQYLKDDGNEFFNCSGDADSTICHTARDLATTVEKEVVLIADDTYIFIVLIYHWKSEMKNIIFFKQKMFRSWNIASLFPRLDKVKITLFLFMR